VNGLAVGPDRVVASASGVEVDVVVAAGYDSVSFLLPFDGLRSALRRRHRDEELRVL
jgi:hypothetical protein